MDHPALINVLPLWNRTTRTDKLAVPTDALGRKHVRNCESGTMIKVCTLNGRIRWLDSHWFKEYV